MNMKWDRDAGFYFQHSHKCGKTSAMAEAISNFLEARRDHNLTDYQRATIAHNERPSIEFADYLTISHHNDLWCVSWDDAAGYGSTPAKAMERFDYVWKNG